MSRCDVEGRSLRGGTFQDLTHRFCSLVIRRALRGSVAVRVEVTNRGNRDDDEVVQLYAPDVLSSLVRPERQLIGFKRLFIRSGETKTLRFSIAGSLLAFLDSDMNWRVEAGQFELLIGASSEDVRARETLTITRDSVIDPKRRDFYCASEVTPRA